MLEGGDSRPPAADDRDFVSETNNTSTIAVTAPTATTVKAETSTATTVTVENSTATTVTAETSTATTVTVETSTAVHPKPSANTTVKSAGTPASPAVPKAGLLRNGEKLKEACKCTNCPVDKCISAEEYEAYKRLFPTVDMVLGKVKCSICDHSFDGSGVNYKFRMHPVLRTVICSDCLNFYQSGEFETGEDGYELYCRWCGQGGEVYCCASCVYVYCEACIEKHCTPNIVQKIKDDDNWKCFSCDPRNIYELRAIYWAYSNYLQILKRILNSSFSRKDKKIVAANAPTKALSVAPILSESTVNASTSPACPPLHKLPATDTITLKQTAAKQNSLVVRKVPAKINTLKPIAPKPLRIMTINQGSGQKKMLLHRVNYSMQPAALPTVSANTTIPAAAFGNHFLLGQQHQMPQRTTSSMPIQRFTLNGNPLVTHRILPDRALAIQQKPMQSNAHLNRGNVIMSVRNPAVLANSSVRVVKPVGSTLQAINTQNLQFRNQPPQLQQPQQPVSILRSRPMPQKVVAQPVRGNGGTLQLTPQPLLNSSVNSTALPVQTMARPVISSVQDADLPQGPLGEAVQILRKRNMDALGFVKYLNTKYIAMQNKTRAQNLNTWDDVKSYYTNLDLMSKHAIHYFHIYRDKCTKDVAKFNEEIEKEHAASACHADEDDDIEVIEPVIESIVVDSDGESESKAPRKAPNSVAPKGQNVLKRNCVDPASASPQAKHPRLAVKSIFSLADGAQSDPKFLTTSTTQEVAALSQPLNQPATPSVGARKKAAAAPATRKAVFSPHIKLHRLEHIYTNFTALLEQSKSQGAGNIINLSQLCLRDQPYFDPMMLCTTVMDPKADNVVANVGQMCKPFPSTVSLSLDICNPGATPPVQLLADDPGEIIEPVPSAEPTELITQNQGEPQLPINNAIATSNINVIENEIEQVSTTTSNKDSELDSSNIPTADIRERSKERAKETTLVDNEKECADTNIGAQQSQPTANGTNPEEIEQDSTAAVSDDVGTTNNLATSEPDGGDGANDAVALERESINLDKNASNYKVASKRFSPDATIHQSRVKIEGLI